MSLAFRPFVYGLVDPAEPGHVRYVGMTTVKASRPYAHMQEARSFSSVSHKIHWIRKVQHEGREPSVLILEQLPERTSVDLVGFVEKCYIKSLRAIGHRLTNIMEGGGNGPHALETKAKISETLMGHQVSEGTRKRSGERIRQYYSKIENRIQRSQSARAAHTETTRLAVSRAQTGRVPDPEMLARRNASIKKAWIKRRAEGKGTHTQATRVLLSAKTSASMTPERREQQRIKAISAWAKKKNHVNDK